jgi:hypothetical protein
MEENEFFHVERMISQKNFRILKEKINFGIA